MVSPSSYALFHGDFRPATCWIAVIHFTGIRMTLQSPNSSRSASPGAGFSCSPPLPWRPHQNEAIRTFVFLQPSPLSPANFSRGVITLRVMGPRPYSICSSCGPLSAKR